MQDNKLYNYAILDAARLYGELEKAKRLGSVFSSLYKGKSEQTLAEVAPYLFACDWSSPLAHWILNEGWTLAHGYFIQSTVSFEELHKHLRKFLIVQDEKGKQLYFRFYDPRVLRIFLPTCDNVQISEFFGPVKHFIVEGDSKDEAIQFSHEDGILRQKKMAAKELADEIPAV